MQHCSTDHACDLSLMSSVGDDSLSHLAPAMFWPMTELPTQLCNGLVHCDHCVTKYRQTYWYRYLVKIVRMCSKEEPWSDLIGWCAFFLARHCHTCDKQVTRDKKMVRYLVLEASFLVMRPAKKNGKKLFQFLKL